MGEGFCGRGFSPDAFRSVAVIWPKSIGAEAPPTKDLVAALGGSDRPAGRINELCALARRMREVCCGRGFSPDAFRSAAVIWPKSLGAEAPPTKDLVAALGGSDRPAGRINELCALARRMQEVCCGRGFSPDAFRSGAMIWPKSIGAEAPPTKDFGATLASGLSAG
ncbi:DUF6053 domain-containing protein [Lysobacter sp. TAB13]|uniref:DUF6053 domain-containing protein n=1 Tax=Lysobacter sp. TAB13 TaxID=3233065 RepID=UPI003F9C6184